MSRDRITTEERRLIDEAVAAGRVKRIEAVDVRAAGEMRDSAISQSMALAARRGAARRAAKSSAKRRNRSFPL